ncbi:DUF1727 domain-containing protein [Schaalia sp. 19OD2882]|uniref:MurT ligase domain-containing protein n=1 Tax=Schaalia sp. 19OD2882 TaxID=2794089 RepID=UPI001C1EB87E|nr:MurT ligase domain-containing protein [Schaalia sp. 19OD2882]QWW19333.1 DUF1727 domain-containing protein [Schaalia sp. 19OD2882]
MTSSESGASRAPATMPLRSRLAVAAGRTAAAASRALGRGSGGMIGGEVAMKVSPAVLADLAQGRRCVIVSGTNGKSTTTRMVRTALGAAGQVASNTNGDNLPSGVLTALMAHPHARMASLEVDEMHVPIVAADVRPAVFVLLNLSRDQLDRVGEIGSVEKRLRRAVTENPGSVVVANCDDPLIASAAWDAPGVVWVAAGASWGQDSVAFPRGGQVAQGPDGWFVRHGHGASGTEEGGATTDEGGAGVGDGDPRPAATHRRPEPHWWLEDVNLTPQGAPGPTATLRGPDGVSVPLALSLPGRVNLGNAAQAVAAAVALGIDPADAARAVGTVSEVAGRYSVHDVEGRKARIMLAKNPAGWQEAMTMLDPAVSQVVVGVNGQVPDGTDLSWLWDVDFELLGGVPGRRIVACGERGADLAVRLEYAGIHCDLVDLPMDALAALEPGKVEMLLNYTSLRDFKKILDQRQAKEDRR